MIYFNNVYEKYNYVSNFYGLYLQEILRVGSSLDYKPCLSDGCSVISII